MDRGIPTEEVLEEMRAADPPVYYLVGTPKGRLTKLERDLLPLPWQAVRPGVQVKLLAAGGRTVRVRRKPRSHPQGTRHAPATAQGAGEAPEATSADEVQRHAAVAAQTGRGQGTLSGRLAVDRDHVAATPKRRAASLPATSASNPDAAAQSRPPNLSPSASIAQKLRQVRRREGRYLLRTNLCGRDPEDLWQFYIQLTEIEAAFKNLKDDLQLRPIYHQLESRIEAHIFVAFMAYCLHVTLRARLKPLAPGLTPRAVLDKFAGIQMLDVHFPTTDGRTLILSRYTEPNPDQRLLVERLNLTLPPQPPPRITAAGQLVR